MIGKTVSYSDHPKPAGKSEPLSKTTASENALRRYPTIGVCGLDCGLCPRYVYTAGTSNAPVAAAPVSRTNIHPVPS